MDFYWKNKPEFCVEVNVFKVRIFAGIPTESEEMKPQWFDLKEIPYKEMWQDDTYWMPLFLNDKKFKGKFIFDDSDNILEKELNEVKIWLYYTIKVDKGLNKNYEETYNTSVQ